MMDFLILSFFLLLILYLVAGPRPFKIPIHNCHVCITGGSSDIGLAIAHRIASEGTLISLLARSLKKLQEAQDSIRQATSVNAQIFSANVRIYDSLYKAVAKARPINVLVVNQGIFVPRELKREARSEIESQGERQLNEGQRTEDEGG